MNVYPLAQDNNIQPIFGLTKLVTFVCFYRAMLVQSVVMRLQFCMSSVRLTVHLSVRNDQVP